jgi:hypothetical protein
MTDISEMSDKEINTFVKKRRANVDLDKITCAISENRVTLVRELTSPLDGYREYKLVIRND